MTSFVVSSDHLSLKSQQRFRLSDEGKGPMCWCGPGSSLLQIHGKVHGKRTQMLLEREHHERERRARSGTLNLLSGSSQMTRDANIGQRRQGDGAQKHDRMWKRVGGGRGRDPFTVYGGSGFTFLTSPVLVTSPPQANGPQNSLYLNTWVPPPGVEVL